MDLPFELQKILVNTKGAKNPTDFMSKLVSIYHNPNKQKQESEARFYGLVKGNPDFYKNSNSHKNDVYSGVVEKNPIKDAFAGLLNKMNPPKQAIVKQKPAGSILGATPSPTPTPSPMPRPTLPPDKAALPFYELINESAKKYGVPQDILYRTIKHESGFNPKAGSPVGAQGIAQFMPATAQGMGVDPMDPNSAIPGAARLLSGHYKAFQDWAKALAAYNAGAGNVRKYGGVPPFKETQNYVKRILGQ